MEAIRSGGNRIVENQLLAPGCEGKPVPRSRGRLRSISPRLGPDDPEIEETYCDLSCIAFRRASTAFSM